MKYLLIMEATNWTIHPQKTKSTREESKNSQAENVFSEIFSFPKHKNPVAARLLCRAWFYVTACKVHTVICQNSCVLLLAEDSSHNINWCTEAVSPVKNCQHIKGKYRKSQDAQRDTMIPRVQSSNHCCCLELAVCLLGWEQQSG